MNELFIFKDVRTEDFDMRSKKITYIHMNLCLRDRIKQNYKETKKIIQKFRNAVI